MSDPSSALKPSRNVVLHRHNAAWLLSDPVIKQHIELDANAVAAFAQLAEGATAQDWTTAFQEGQGWVRTTFDPSQGLWADPTCLGERQGSALSGASLTEELSKRHLLLPSEDGDAYSNYYKPLVSVLDRAHLGTFNDRVGQYLIRDLRLKQTWRWWHDQKFFPDGLSLRPGPYRDVQEHFFDQYFDEAKLKGRRLLDFACGNGHYAKRFAAKGAKVTGVDTCQELIDLAKANYGGSADFICMIEPANVLNVLKKFENQSFDIIYLSDIFLILAESPDASGLAALLDEFKRLLAPRGKLHMMEPSGLFWLSPRIGPVDQPLVVVTEYRQQIYNVAPTFDRVCAFMATGGFALTELKHPGPSEKAEPAVYAYSTRFPMWDFTTWISV